MLRTGLVQLNPTVGDVEGNAARILTRWREAADAGCDLVVFTELAVAGYPPEDLLFKPEFVAANATALDRLAADGPEGSLAVVGFAGTDTARAADGPDPDTEGGWDVSVSHLGLRNSAAVLADGQVRGVYHKGRLPNYGVFDEARYFLPGERPLVVEVAGVAVGITICEDLWVAEGPVTGAVERGARVVVNLNASPFHAGKRAERERWVRHHARHHGIHVAYVNQVGGQDELVFDGDSLVCGPDGEVLARGAQFAEDTVVVDLEVTQAPAGEGGTTPARAGEAPGRTGDVPGRTGDVPGRTGAEPDPTGRTPGGAGRHRRPLPDRHEPERLDRVAEVWEALVLGTRDYCRKNGFQQAVVGLSGGIDSSVTLAVACDALGPGNVMAVAMPSPHSSPESLEDARAVAGNLGADLEVVPIQPAMEAFDGMLAEPFAGLPEDVTEENLQARIRGIVLMAFSNKLGRILLSTGNKSELAVGYATLYGDMAGGFSVLKDCLKGLVYELAHHRNGRSRVIPERVLSKPPSAELRPGQRDSDSLPPYRTLDPIVAAYVEDDCSVEEMVAAGHDPGTVRQVVALIDGAEYKRRQAPPGVKITERAFGKDRRVPITNAWRPGRPSVRAATVEDWG